MQRGQKEHEEDGAAVIAVLTFGEADEQLQLTRLELKQLSLEHLAMLWKVHSRNGFFSIVLKSPLQCLSNEVLHPIIIDAQIFAQKLVRSMGVCFPEAERQLSGPHAERLQVTSFLASMGPNA